MKAIRTPISLGIAAVCAMLPSLAEAAPPVPASLEEMWKIIQQQQKEIETLKAKAKENEALKKEVNELKSGQHETAKAAPQAATAPAPVGAAAGKSAAEPAVKGKAGKSDIERKTDILAAEVEKLKTKLYIPEKREYKTEYGFGPAASEVYRVNRGLSIGGYGEAVYTDYVGDKNGVNPYMGLNGNAKNTADMERAVLYVGYKFNDWIVLNNEFEFEHATTGEGDEQKGEVSVEFSQLDFFLHKNANVRAGLMLVPMGFINEIHEPVTFHGNYRPNVEQYIIPTTWREMGAGLFGEIIPGLQYRMYAMNGLNAKGYQSTGIAEGRQGGSFAVAEDWAYTGRLDYSPSAVPGLLVGASTFVGNAGQNELYLGQKIAALTQLYEGHVQWYYRGLEFRALGAYGSIGNAAQLSAAKGETIGSSNYGWYTELAYDVMPWLWKDSAQYLAPFFRYERYNTLAGVPKGFDSYGGLYDQWLYQAGLTYRPIPNISVKLDYRNINSAATTPVPDQLNLGVGFIY